MATNVSVTSSFDGVNHKDMFVQLFLKAQTISENLITVLPNVLGSVKLPKLTYSAEFVSASCGFNPTGTIALNEKKILVEDFQIQHEICKRDFKQTFQAQNAGLFSAHAEIPSDIKEAVLMAIVSNAAVKIDQFIWNSTATGLLDQFEADSTVQKLPAAVVTKANVEAAFEAIDTALIPEIDNEDGLVFVVARNVANAYRYSQNTMGMNTSTDAKDLQWMGRKVAMLNTLPANTIIAYRVQNVFFGTSIESDMTEIVVEDQRIRETIETSLKVAMGQGYVWGGEIVYYRTV